MFASSTSYDFEKALSTLHGENIRRLKMFLYCPFT